MNMCCIGIKTIRTYALQESHQYKHMLFRKVTNMNIGTQESQQHEHMLYTKVNSMKICFIGMPTIQTYVI